MKPVIGRGRRFCGSRERHQETGAGAGAGAGADSSSGDANGEDCGGGFMTAGTGTGRACEAIRTLALLGLFIFIPIVRSFHRATLEKNLAVAKCG